MFERSIDCLRIFVSFGADSWSNRVEPSDFRKIHQDIPLKEKSIFSRLLKALALLLFLLAGAAAILLVFDVPIPLNRYRDDIEAQLTEGLDRKISIDGDILLVSGATPSVRVEKLTVGNPQDWETENAFASIERFETSIGLAELLHQNIDINNITIAGIQLALEVDTEGRSNWESLTGSGEIESGEERILDDEIAGLDLDFTGLDLVTINDLSITRRIAGGEAVQILELDSLMGSAMPGKPVQLAVDGHLRKLPFRGTFKGGTLDALLAGAHEWPFEYEGELQDATLDVRGKMAAQHFMIPGTMDFKLEIPDVQQLKPLIGPLPLSGALRVTGQVLRESPGLYRFPNLNGELTGASIAGSVVLNLEGRHPDLGGEIEVGTIDFVAAGITGDELQESISQIDDEDSPTAEPEPTSETLLPLTGDFALKIKEITGLATSVRDVSLDLEVTETNATAGMKIEFAGDQFEGQLDLERTGGENPIAMEIDLNGTDADLTELVRYFIKNDRFSGKFETGRFRVEGKGDTLEEAWEQRLVDFQVTNAPMTWKSSKKEWQFFVETGDILRKPGSPGEIRAKGKIGDANADLRAVYHLLDDNSTSRFDEIAGTVADVEFEIQDVTKEDAEDPYRHLKFSVKGGRLDRLDSIYELDLPPVGPYAASGLFKRKGDEIAIENMELQIGDNRLLGNWQLDRGTDPQKLTGTLNAETIQIGEFSGKGWSPIVKSLQTGEAEEVAEEARRKLLSYEILSALDAEIELEVGSVVAGSDTLGKGNLNLSLDGARLQIEPLNVDIPGGHFDGSFLFHPKGDGSLDWKIRVDAKKADYGILVRRINAESKAAGVLNLDLDVAASGVPFGAPQLNVATGDLSFNVCPKNVDASGLDIWAISLVQALLPKLDPEEQSKLNCILGKLHLEDGVITPESLGLDTSTIRVVADGQIDLKGDTIDLKLTPYPKNPQLLSVEAPVSIQGPLENPEIGMGKLATARTVGRMAKNIVLFPLKAIASERLPEDGSDICACAENYSPDPELNGALVPKMEGKQDGDEKSGDESDRKE